MRNTTDNISMASSMGIVFRILNRLDLMLDMDEADTEQVSAKSLGISENRWEHYIKMLYEAEYIDGVDIRETIDGETNTDISDIGITLKGLQYLAENSAMMRLRNAAKSLGMKIVEAGAGAGMAAIIK